MYNVKICFIIPSVTAKTGNLTRREIADFLKFTIIYARENIYVHSNLTGYLSSRTTYKI